MPNSGINQELPKPRSEDTLMMMPHPSQFQPPTMDKTDTKLLDFFYNILAKKWQMDLADSELEEYIELLSEKSQTRILSFGGLGGYLCSDSRFRVSQNIASIVSPEDYPWLEENNSYGNGNHFNLNPEAKEFIPQRASHASALPEKHDKNQKMSPFTNVALKTAMFEQLSLFGNDKNDGISTATIKRDADVPDLCSRTQPITKRHDSWSPYNALGGTTLMSSVWCKSPYTPILKVVHSVDEEKNDESDFFFTSPKITSPYTLLDDHTSKQPVSDRSSAKSEAASATMNHDADQPLFIQPLNVLSTYMHFQDTKTDNLSHLSSRLYEHLHPLPGDEDDEDIVSSITSEMHHRFWKVLQGQQLPALGNDSNPLTSEQDSTTLISDQNSKTLTSDQDSTLLTSDQDSTLLTSDQDSTTLTSDQDRTPVTSDQDSTTLTSDRSATLPSDLLPTEKVFQSRYFLFPNHNATCERGSIFLSSFNDSIGMTDSVTSSQLAFPTSSVCAAQDRTSKIPATMMSSNPEFKTRPAVNFCLPSSSGSNYCKTPGHKRHHFCQPLETASILSENKIAETQTDIIGIELEELFEKLNTLKKTQTFTDDIVKQQEATKEALKSCQEQLSHGTSVTDELKHDVTFIKNRIQMAESSEEKWEGNFATLAMDHEILKFQNQAQMVELKKQLEAEQITASNFQEALTSCHEQLSHGRSMTDELKHDVTNVNAIVQMAETSADRLKEDTGMLNTDLEILKAQSHAEVAELKKQLEKEQTAVFNVQKQLLYLVKMVAMSKTDIKILEADNYVKQLYDTISHTMTENLPRTVCEKYEDFCSYINSCIGFKNYVEVIFHRLQEGLKYGSSVDISEIEINPPALPLPFQFAAFSSQDVSHTSNAVSEAVASIHGENNLTDNKKVRTNEDIPISTTVVDDDAVKCKIENISEPCQVNSSTHQSLPKLHVENSAQGNRCDLSSHESLLLGEPAETKHHHGVSGTPNRLSNLHTPSSKWKKVISGRAKSFSSPEVGNNSLASNRNIISEGQPFQNPAEIEQGLEIDMEVDEGLAILSDPSGALTKTFTKAKLSSVSIEADTLKVMLVVDTNVLISCLNFLQDILTCNIPGYGGVILVLPWIVMQELDRLKDRKYSVNNLARSISTSQKAGKAVKFIHTHLVKNISQLIGQTPQEAFKETDLPVERNDDRVLQCCRQFEQKYAGSQVVLLTRDMNLINKAMIIGIQAATDETLWSHLKVKKPYLGKRQMSTEKDNLPTKKSDKRKISGKYRCNINSTPRFRDH